MIRRFLANVRRNLAPTIVGASVGAGVVFTGSEALMTVTMAVCFVVMVVLRDRRDDGIPPARTIRGRR